MQQEIPIHGYQAVAGMDPIKAARAVHVQIVTAAVRRQNRLAGIQFHPQAGHIGGGAAIRGMEGAGQVLAALGLVTGRQRHRHP